MLFILSEMNVSEICVSESNFCFRAYLLYYYPISLVYFVVYQYTKRMIFNLFSQ